MYASLLTFSRGMIARAKYLFLSATHVTRPETFCFTTSLKLFASTSVNSPPATADAFAKFDSLIVFRSWYRSADSHATWYSKLEMIFSMFAHRWITSQQ